MQKTVTVVGLGYVGLPLALRSLEKGCAVTGVDYSADKVAAINRGDSTLHDEAIDAQLKKLQLKATTDYAAAKDSDVIIVCVPTPVDEHSVPDLTPVTNAAAAIAGVLKKGQLVIVESTINPGVCDDVVIPLIEKHSRLTCGRDFFLAHCPERINPGDSRWDVGNIPRVVGGRGPHSLELALEFYRAIIDADIKPMASLQEAEAVKVVENSFRDVNIAFVNELAMSFEALGIDVLNVIEGAATKPFAFMPHYPGIGVGGHCIPVDPYYLIEYARQKGFTHRFLQTARDINKGMPAFAVGLLEQSLLEAGLNLQTAKVAVLGLSYKADVGDLRESPALDLIDQLRAKGIRLTAFDPYISKLPGVPLATDAAGQPATDVMEAIRGANVLIIATAHREIKALRLGKLAQASVKVIIDGRNCLDKARVRQLGMVYRGIGR